MLVTSRAQAPATDLDVGREVSSVLERRATTSHPPLSMTVSDAVALGIAGIFRSATESGQVFDRFVRIGSVDASELIEAARFEQGYASSEGHAALYCLICWVQARLDQPINRHVAAR